MKQLCMSSALWRVSASALALATALSVLPADAAGTATADPCSSPLPPQMAFIGGSNLKAFTLHAPFGILTITRIPRVASIRELRLLGYRERPGDAVGDFSLVSRGGKHIYAGPVHIFQHANRAHICRAGAIQVNAAGNTTEQINRHRLNLKIDGTILGRRARATVWIGSAHYHFFGTRTT